MGNEPQDEPWQARVERAMHERQLSQNKLAEYCGVPQPTLNKWFGGTRRKGGLTRRQFQILANGLNKRGRELGLPDIYPVDLDWGEPTEAYLSQAVTRALRRAADASVSIGPGIQRNARMYTAGQAQEVQAEGEDVQAAARAVDVDSDRTGKAGREGHVTARIRKLGEHKTMDRPAVGRKPKAKPKTRAKA